MVSSMTPNRPLRWGFLFAALVLGVGAVILLTRALAWPNQADVPKAPPEAGLRVESVLAQVLMREAGLTARQDPLVLASEEVNAFLAGHVEVRDSPVWPIRVEIYPTEVELGGATTVGHLVEAGLGQLFGRLL